MADPDDSQGARPRQRRRIYHGNTRVPWVVMGVLIFLFVLGGIVVGTKKTGSPDPGVRAVIVPTANQARTVVIPPCDTGVPITDRNAAAQVETPGATVVGLPKSTVTRSVLVPQCASALELPPGQRPPSEAVVLAPGATPKTRKDKVKVAAESQVIVPNDSDARTVVVPACTTGKGGEDRVLRARAGRSRAVIAPTC
ncbi:MAG: hypothetical protein M3296_03570 [Actinomycetota bacterium]|nr:hypothetical protein [Actinomycetota bacterium]